MALSCGQSWALVTSVASLAEINYPSEVIFMTDTSWARKHLRETTNRSIGWYIAWFTRGCTEGAPFGNFGNANVCREGWTPQKATCTWGLRGNNAFPGQWHQGGGNVLFVDGHVKWMPFEKTSYMNSQSQDLANWRLWNPYAP
jgi:prepilin-type processing-associated H-X9-DG protein